MSQLSRRFYLIAGTGLLATVLLLFAGWQRHLSRPAVAPSDQPTPNPGLAPAEVVLLQLVALQQNGDGDQGIATAFNFASPGNKEATGPLSRFRQLVRSPAYAPLLTSATFRTEALVVEGEVARQVVVVTDGAGQEAAYLFELSRQPRPPYQDCWMTDGVIRLKRRPQVRT